MAFIWFLVFVFCYFLPSAIARNRDRAMVFVLNLFLGWTLVGWVVALAIALRPAPKDGAA